MTTVVKQSRLLFLNTDTLTNGVSDKAKVILPNNSFSVCCGDTMRLTLLQLVMSRNFHNVSSVNNVFYVRDDSTDNYKEILIPEGSYVTHDALADAIQVGLRNFGGADHTGSTCTYDDDTRKLFITMPGVSNTSYLVCFHSKTGTKPVGVSDAGFFNQSYILLGAKPSLTSTPINAYASLGTSAMSSPYAASLSTITALYLRCNLLGQNFQSLGHERYLPSGNMLMESQIWARIPIPLHTKKHDFDPIIFEDSGGDMFQLRPSQHSLDSLELWLTDEYGRTMPDISVGQAADGMKGFTCTVRWDVMTPDKKTPPTHTPTLQGGVPTQHVPNP